METSTKPGHLPAWKPIVLALAGLTVAALSFAPYGELRSERRRLQALLEERGVGDTHPETLAALGREQDPERGKLLVSRALLAFTLERLASAELPLDAAAVGDRVRDLDLSYALAREAVRERPAAWQAHMILGAATYLKWSLLRDRRVVTDAKSWEDPLETALEIAPTQGEPKRFLALAYLELWPMLSAAKRQSAREVIQFGLGDPRILRRALPRWLEVVEDVESALASLPDEPVVWGTVLRVFAEQGDWPRYRGAWQRRREALRRTCAEQLHDAERSLSHGDASSAVRTLLAVAADLPLEREWATFLVAALEQLPAGTPSGRAREPFRAWLQWGLERCRFSDCALPATTVARLAGLAGDMPAPIRAEAALAADDLATAERWERSAARPKGASWAEYWIQKVPHLLRRQELDGAAEALERVHRSHHSTYAYLERARALALARKDSGAAATASRLLRQLIASAWPSDAWSSLDDRHHRLPLVVGEAAAGLAIELAERPPRGGVVEVYLDGGLLGLEVLPGSLQRNSSIYLQSPINPGHHLLEIVAVAGGRMAPGPVRLVSRAR